MSYFLLSLSLYVFILLLLLLSVLILRLTPTGLGGIRALGQERRGEARGHHGSSIRTAASRHARVWVPAQGIGRWWSVCRANAANIFQIQVGQVNREREKEIRWVGWDDIRSRFLDDECMSGEHCMQNHENRCRRKQSRVYRRWPAFDWEDAQRLCRMGEDA